MCKEHIVDAVPKVVNFLRAVYFPTTDSLEIGCGLNTVVAERRASCSTGKGLRNDFSQLIDRC